MTCRKIKLSIRRRHSPKIPRINVTKANAQSTKLSLNYTDVLFEMLWNVIVQLKGIIEKLEGYKSDLVLANSIEDEKL